MTHALIMRTAPIGSAVQTLTNASSLLAATELRIRKNLTLTVEAAARNAEFLNHANQAATARQEHAILGFAAARKRARMEN